MNPCGARRAAFQRPLIAEGVKNAVNRLDIVGDDRHALAAFGVLALKLAVLVEQV